MAEETGFWQRQVISRRRALQGAAAAAGGVTALSLIGCGDDNNSSGGEAGSTKVEQVDWTKGKPGGLLSMLNPNYPVSLDIVNRSGGQGRPAGLTHSGLMAFKSGKSGVEQSSLEPEPDAAVALPEQPNDTTYTFKIRPGIKFHNGRELTSEDVKYSFDRYAFETTSIHKAGFDWLDKIEVPDKSTVTFRAKEPNSDSLYNMIQYTAGYILAKEHEEGPNAQNGLMGSGPYIWDSSNQPISFTLRKNPDYFMKPYPYIDKITMYTITDDAKKVADFISKQVQFTFHNTGDLAQQITSARPEVIQHFQPASGFVTLMRLDQDPWKDKRVRQAISRGVDRDKIKQAIENGEGGADTALSWGQSGYWGARKPEELKSAANWKYDPASAKQLFAAAGHTKPIEMPFSFTDSGGWQAGRDSLVLAFSNWKEHGIANFASKPVNQAVFNDTVLLGQYDGAASFFSFMQPIFGTRIKQLYWSPAGGPEARSPNSSKLNDPNLNRLIDRNLTTFKIEDRRAIVRDIDELMGEEQYRPSFVTRLNRWFTDPSLKNAVVYHWAAIGTASYLKYWWFE